MSSATTTPAPPSSGNLNILVVLSYVTIVGIWIASQFILIPYVVHLLVLVTAILYAACHQSLILRQDPTVETNEDGTTTTVSPQVETLRTEDAMQFPILGSASLFGLYLAFKFLDKELVNLLIGVYFGAVGVFAITATISPFAPTLGARFNVDKKITHPLPKWLVDSPIHIILDISMGDILVFIGSCVFCSFYFMYKHWAMNNVMGICFCLQGIERFSLGTFKIGAILLIGLFFYDIFWVFGTDVMVTVAKSLDGPIKILFPRTWNDEMGKWELSLLGLGDIVIPGFFLALLLRFDAHKAKVPTNKIDIHFPFPKPYFHSALFAYFLGLGLTMYIMIVFNAAQPALLYLVPACLLSSLSCAFLKGEANELFAYSEEEEEPEKPQDDAKGEAKETVDETKKEK